MSSSDRHLSLLVVRATCRPSWVWKRFWPQGLAGFSARCKAPSWGNVQKIDGPALPRAALHRRDLRSEWGPPLEMRTAARGPATLSMLSAVLKLLTRERSPGQLYNAWLAHHYTSAEIVRHQPVRLGICTSFECNLACNMCPTHSRLVPDNPYKYKGAQTMSFELFRDIVDRFANAMIASFIGNGEPLLCPDLFEMIEYARYKRRMSSSLCTNGVLLRKHLDRAVTAPLDIINISMNGHTPEHYEYITGQSPDLWRRIRDNVKALLDACRGRRRTPKIAISVIIDRHTFRTIPDIIEFAENLCVDSVSICQVMPTAAKGRSAKERCVFASDQEARQLLETLHRRPTRVSVTLPALLDASANTRVCRDAFYSMSVDGDGNVGGCERQLLNVEGNGAYRDPDVFNNTHFRKLRRALMGLDAELPQPCRTCYNNTTYPMRPLNCPK